MDIRIADDLNTQKPLRIVKFLYLLSALILCGHSLVKGDWFSAATFLSTLILFPGIALLRRLFHLNGGFQMELFVYLFSFLSWTMGGAGSVYRRLPGYDKIVHCLSGVFVSMLALAFFRMLERGHNSEGKNSATARWFVFFASMAVAGMFELCEFTLAPIMGRDLQHVLDTGVADTMGDIFVCMLGTIVYVLLMLRQDHGKPCFLVNAAEAFVDQNPKR